MENQENNQPAWDKISEAEKEQLTDYFNYLKPDKILELSKKQLIVYKNKIDEEIKQILTEAKRESKSTAERLKMEVGYLEEVSNIIAKLLNTGQILRLEIRR